MKNQYVYLSLIRSATVPCYHAKSETPLERGETEECRFSRSHPFSSGGCSCNLCITEKLVILTADQSSMLNKRDKILEACRHWRKQNISRTKNVLRNWYSSMKKKLRKIPMNFDIENWLWKSNLGTFWHLLNNFVWVYWLNAKIFQIL